MTLAPFHGWTHRPKALGGTDPLPINLPWAYGTHETSQEMGAGSEELAFDNFFTNAPDVFALDTGGVESGIFVYEQAFVIAAAFVDTSGSPAATLYTQIQPASSYPTFGTEFGWSGSSGPFAFMTSLLDTTQPRQNHIGMGRVFGTGAAPWRAVAAMSTPAPVTVTTGGLVVIRVGTF